eukprot:CAMPEP_0185024014 /NCGR_PEP_ID=MMETSP1103-20130426/6886_1 /TAXON_ID=36769 /ORGANISM="Paraphysomonas bandaiensis, Strain Caron Lab Isolate" /LENGTH=262 /DNA_ID=CAMNT_0027556849 /DNA_START=121 /DNA_END=906 /DNA_ORIENTATION=+
MVLDVAFHISEPLGSVKIDDPATSEKITEEHIVEVVQQDGSNPSSFLGQFELHQMQAKASLTDEYYKVFQHFCAHHFFLYYDNPELVLTLITTMQSMKLSPVLAVIKRKEIWVDMARAYSHVDGYYIEGNCLSHWSLYLRLRTKDGNKVFHGKIELLGEKMCDDNTFYDSVKNVNGRVNMKTRYIVTRFNQGIMDKNYKDCNVPWIKMWTSYLMDSEHFKPYDADINNCHQFIQRVCRRVELRTNKFTFVDEKIAKKARGQW